MPRRTTEVLTPKVEQIKGLRDRPPRASGRGKLLEASVVTRLERRYQVFEMRKAGYAMHKIAEALGCDVATVRDDLRVVLSNMVKQTNETAEEARQLELERYDEALKFYYPLAINGNLAAMAVILQVSSQRRKLLALDVPETKNVNLTGVREYIGVDLEQV